MVLPWFSGIKFVNTGSSLLDGIKAQDERKIDCKIAMKMIKNFLFFSILYILPFFNKLLCNLWDGYKTAP